MRSPEEPKPPSETELVGAGDDDVLRLPDSGDLLKNLRFSMRDGRISLAGERMVLLHVHALGELRRHLIDTVGTARARSILVRIGYASGHRDIVQARRIRKDASLFELLSAGPQLHALEGMVAAAPAELRIDRARGRYYGEFTWRNSAEAEASLKSAGVSSEPVCWLMLGYASGFTSGFMGQPIVYREVACRGCGARICRIVGRPLPAWDTLPEEFRFLLGDSPTAPAETVELPPNAPDRPLLGDSSTIAAVRSLVERVAPTTTPVLIRGEYGTGRSHLAATIHSAGARRSGPLIVVGSGLSSASAITRALAEAAGGTLVLDDIGEWSPDAQRSLLELGDGRHHPSRARLIITAADCPGGQAQTPLLARLLHRVGAFPVFLPPLRERREDIPALARHYLERIAARLEKPPRPLTARAYAYLHEHDYPGNLHELANILERAMILVDGSKAIDIGDLISGEAEPSRLLRVHDDGTLAAAPTPKVPHEPVDLEAVIEELLVQGLAFEDVESALICGAVDRHKGNLAAAARSLGLTRPQLAYRYRKACGEG